MMFNSLYPRILFATTLLSAVVSQIAAAQPMMIRGTLDLNWSGDESRCWFVEDDWDGKFKVIAVDCNLRRRAELVNSDQLTTELQAALNDQTVQVSSRAMQRSLYVSDDSERVYFSVSGKSYCFNTLTTTLNETTNDTLPEAAIPAVPLRSSSNGGETLIAIRNNRNDGLTLKWRDTQGGLKAYGRVAAGESISQHTFAGHVWELYDPQENLVYAFETLEGASEIVIDDSTVAPKRSGRRSRRNPGSPRQRRFPPPGVSVDYRNADVEVTFGSEATIRSKSGTQGNPFQWHRASPDGQAIIVARVRKGDHRLVHLIESSPKAGGRAALSTREYPLPGDAFDAYELHLVTPDQAEVRSLDIKVDFGRPRLHFTPDGRACFVTRVSRGHQKLEVIRIDLPSGNTRTILVEESDTFVWTMHGPPVPPITFLDECDEIIHSSEKSGFRHLSLLDARTGRTKNEITLGAAPHNDWLVRRIESIDTEARTITFWAGGLDIGQDPYHEHLCRIAFDGSGFTRLTEGDGTHEVTFSPSGKYVLDRYSRVDLPPVSTLREFSNGAQVCQLTEAETRQWSAPVRFSAKGRDGETSIWGIIFFPSDFDKTQRYPIIEDIYAGPHDSHVPKRFSLGARYRRLTEAGFVVVKIDAMGTANRSKAFHDVCWQNLRDAGFPDRIRWIQAAAEQYPAMDIRRVGIYGTSAGGQNAAGAVLFHGDFYKAAAASCGCHDNRMDKASWNEQWMGYPVGIHYSQSSNIDNAHRLSGELMLIVGELDTNVPPESTMRFVDALIDADKDFDLLVIPGMGHSDGGTYGRRRRLDFFREHLQTRDIQ